jgi:hypothetical protein
MSETADDDEDLERPRFIRMGAEDTFDGQERVMTPGLRRVPGLPCLSGMRVIGRNRTVDGRGHAT